MTAQIIKLADRKAGHEMPLDLSEDRADELQGAIVLLGMWAEMLGRMTDAHKRKPTADSKARMLRALNELEGHAADARQAL